MLWFFRPILCLVIVVVAPAWAAGESELPPDQFFDEQVQPILAEHCFKCHGGEAQVKGGLRLTDHESFLQGGDSGSPLEENLFVEAINYEGYEMPPKGKLPAEQIAILTKWVKLGAPWSKTTKDFGQHGEEEHGEPRVNDATKAFWAYQPVRRPEIPETDGGVWVASPIDAFIYAKLAAAGLQPNDPAEPAKLIRRAYYDLTGLPPKPEDVRAFVAAPSRKAYEQLIDKLLRSRQYGERWGRHWLDLVRYAESNSFERDGAKPHIWRYRDYVIASLNADKPYDVFVREQLAGDELNEVTPASYIATGYYRIGQWDDEPTDQLQADFDGLDDILATTGQVLLGMTINCARCHNHKIDPIPQHDYYRMLAFFRGVKPYGHRRLDPTNTRMFDLKTGAPVALELAEKLRQERQQLERTVRQIENRVRKHLTEPEKEDFAFEDNRVAIIKAKANVLKPNDVQEYETALAQLRNVRSQDDEMAASTLTAFGVSEQGSEVPPTFVMIRGNAHAQGDEVSPGFPSVLSFPDPGEVQPQSNSSGRRLALANWIVSESNPLTARVLVNRLWQHHFGRGIVDTPNDFGFQGARPTHPELLDWLADEFMAGGWTLKRMHKLIMLSNTYRMASSANPEGLAQDVDNRLLWRMNMRRLSAEEIRDSILAANGTLNLKSGGPSIYPRIPAEVLAGQSRPGAGWGNSSPEEAARRSVYIHVKRSLVTPILASFDFADTDFSCPVRFATTQPTQALGMMNSEFLNEQAALFADRIKDEGGTSLEDQVRYALNLVTQREPSSKEITSGVEFIEKIQKNNNQSEEVALNQYCLLMLNLNEFIYLD